MKRRRTERETIGGQEEQEDQKGQAENERSKGEVVRL